MVVRNEMVADRIQVWESSTRQRTVDNEGIYYKVVAVENDDTDKASYIVLRDELLSDDAVNLAARLRVLLCDMIPLEGMRRRIEDLQDWSDEMADTCLKEFQPKDQGSPSPWDEELSAAMSKVIRSAVIESHDALIMKLYETQQELASARDDRERAEEECIKRRRECSEAGRYAAISYATINEALGEDLIACSKSGATAADHYAASIKRLQRERSKTMNDVGIESLRTVMEDLISRGRENRISQALSSLEGDLSYDKVAKAKKVLLSMIDAPTSSSKCSRCGCDCPGCGCGSGCCTNCGCCNK